MTRWRSIRTARSASAVIMRGGAIGAFASLALNGVPLLRHDWHWPINGTSAVYLLSEALSGWRPDGIGGPNPYPTEYLYGSLSALLALVFSPTGGLLVFLIAMAIVADAVVGRVAARYAVPPLGRAALLMLVLFNPWVYTEVVAGHLFMIVAAIGLLYLSSILGDSSSSDMSLGTAAILASAQFQLFLLSIPFIAYEALRRRRIGVIVLCAVLLAPLLLGIASNTSAVQATPFAAVWEQQQSVPIRDAVLLDGYFAGYAHVFSYLAKWPIAFALTLSVLSIVLRDRRSIVLLGCAAAAFFFSSGYRGPLAGFYAWLIVHVKAAGLYRELYDLLCIALCWYVIGMAAVLGRYQRYAILAALVMLVLPVSWLTYSPWHFFVASKSWPRLTFCNASPATRFALMPPFQPLSLYGRGSGADPDAFIRNGMAPLNEYIPSYPGDVALLKYAAHRDATGLAALGTSNVVWRRGVATRLGPQNPYTVSTARRPTTCTAINASAILSEGPTPPTALVGSDLSKPALLLADDARAGTDLMTNTDVADNVNYWQQWVPANLLFLHFPSQSEPLGGVGTASRAALTLESPKRWLLVDVRGALVENGRRVLRSNGGPTWLYRPQSHSTLHCIGSCVIIAEATRKVDLPLNGIPDTANLLAYIRPFPWLVVTRTSGAQPFLQFRERYDRWWLAFDGRTILDHVRVNHIFNGWAVMRKPERLFIIEVIALLQFCLEVLAISFAMLWLVRHCIDARAQRA